VREAKRLVALAILECCTARGERGNAYDRDDSPADDLGGEMVSAVASSDTDDTTLFFCPSMGRTRQNTCRVGFFKKAGTPGRQTYAHGLPGFLHV
jgi:hypothetical protein